MGKQVTSIVVPCCSARNVPEELGLDVRVHRNELHSEPVKLLVESASNPVVSIDLYAEGLSVKDFVVENIGELRLLKLAEGLRQSYSPSGDINFWIIQGDCPIAPGARWAPIHVPSAEAETAVAQPFATPADTSSTGYRSTGQTATAATSEPATYLEIDVEADRYRPR